MQPHLPSLPVLWGSVLPAQSYSAALKPGGQGDLTDLPLSPASVSLPGALGGPPLLQEEPSLDWGGRTSLV